MSKSSVTNRGTPAKPAAAASGSLVVQAETLTVETAERMQLIDVTERVTDVARQTGVRDGIVSLWSLHTTCALFINEAQRALHTDIIRALETIVAREAPWLHNDPDHSDCDRFNADSHLRAMLLGHSVTLQIAGGELVLGQWQRILMAELDGPRSRTLRVQVMGL